MEIYGRVRRAVRVEGRSQRAVAKEFGLSRETVRKMLQYAVPPGVSGSSQSRGVPALGDAHHGFPYLSGVGRLIIKDCIMLGAPLSRWRTRRERTSNLGRNHTRQNLG